MDKKLLRDYFIELVGTFFLVLIAAGVACVNTMTQPAGQSPGMTPLTLHQPGVLGVAAAQGLIWAVMLALTAPITGGCLNPAITLMLWLFNRLNTARASWLIGAQLVGSVLAGLCLRYTFATDLLQDARFGTPHVNPLAYPNLTAPLVIAQGGIWAGTGVEVVLTFALVFAMFGNNAESGFALQGAWLGGAALAACVLVAYPLTGAALNPARWFGPVAWETLTAARGGRQHPFADAFVYVAGPIVGAVAAGWWCFKIHRPGLVTK